MRRNTNGRWLGNGQLPRGFDCNAGKNLPEVITRSKVVPADKDWEFITKMTMVMRDILYGNPKLDELLARRGAG